MSKKLINTCVVASGVMLLGVGSAMAAPVDKGCYVTKIHPFSFHDECIDNCGGDAVIIHVHNQVAGKPNGADVSLCGHEVPHYDISGYNVDLTHSHIIVKLDEHSSRSGEACLVEVKLYYFGAFFAPAPSNCSAWSYNEDFVINDFAASAGTSEDLGTPW